MHGIISPPFFPPLFFLFFYNLFFSCRGPNNGYYFPSLKISSAAHDMFTKKAAAASLCSLSATILFLPFPSPRWDDIPAE